MFPNLVQQLSFFPVQHFFQQTGTVSAVGQGIRRAEEAGVLSGAMLVQQTTLNQAVLYFPITRKRLTQSKIS